MKTNYRVFAVGLTLLGLSLSAPQRVNAQAPAVAAATTGAIDPEKEKAIRRLLTMTGITKNSIQAMSQMIETQKRMNPNIPAEFWDRFRKKLNENELAALSIPIYDKYFTIEDINGLIAFYETPIGQKSIATMPQVMQESMAAGQKWGQAVGEQVAREMQQEAGAARKQAPAATGKPSSATTRKPPAKRPAGR
jgi:hypothetical protein